MRVTGFSRTTVTAPPIAYGIATIIGNHVIGNHVIGRLVDAHAPRVVTATATVGFVTVTPATVAGVMAVAGTGPPVNTVRTSLHPLGRGRRVPGGVGLPTFLLS